MSRYGVTPSGVARWRDAPDGDERGQPGHRGRAAVGAHDAQHGQLAKELAVSRTVIRSWAEAGLIQPEVCTPGGHYRWVFDDVKRQLRDAPRLRDEPGNPQP